MIPLFDAHCDTITACIHSGAGLRDNDLHTDLRRGMAHAPYAQIFAIFDRPPGQDMMSYDAPDAPGDVLYPLCREILESLKSELESNRDIAALCLNAGDAKKAACQGKCAGFISVEGAELLACDRENLRAAYDDGVRILNLCWNFDNRLTGTAMGPTRSGLTDEGREFVVFAQKLGVLLDMSHISERGFWDVMEISRGPVIASHSNSRKVHPHPRNLTDRQFRALAEAGGGAGLNLCADFVGRDPDIGDAVGHIEHFLALGGEKAVFIGSDFDGIDAAPEGIEGIEDLCKIYEALLRRNYSEGLVRDVFYNNLIDIMEKVL